jgi:hypothetical protein
VPRRNGPPRRILSVEDARNEAKGVDLPFAPTEPMLEGAVSTGVQPYLPGHAYGIPTSDVAAVIPVDDPRHPETLADFVWLLVTVRQSGRLVERTATRQQGRPERKLLSRWLLWGALNVTPDRALVVGSLAVAPARPHDEPGAANRGVTTELLRLVSPAVIAARATERLRQYGNVHDAEKLHPGLAYALQRLDKVRIVAATTPDEQIKYIARAYVQLSHNGNRKPVSTIAKAFGLTRAQARDRVRRARVLGYLEASTAGKVNALPGPRLLLE